MNKGKKRIEEIDSTPCSSNAAFHKPKTNTACCSRDNAACSVCDHGIKIPPEPMLSYGINHYICDLEVKCNNFKRKDRK